MSRSSMGKLSWIAAFAVCCGTGCVTPPPYSPADMFSPPPVAPVHAPHELEKTVLPTYTVEPPDILEIDVVNVVPKAPYALKVLDTVAVHVLGTLPDQPIADAFTIEPGGIVNLGVGYGAVKVSGLTTEQAAEAIRKHLSQFLSEPEVSVTLADIAARQQIGGEHLVAPDGTVTLGSYGNVSIVGKTLDEAKQAIEAHLKQYLEDPIVSVNVFAYNSRTYYVIYQGAGLGDQVVRLPITGNETVLDAISQVNGLGQTSSRRVWVARPGKNGHGKDQILPVAWKDITQYGDVATNYQVLPGDRIYVGENKLIAFDNGLAKLLAPAERIFGFSVLGVGTVTRFTGRVLAGGGNPLGRGNF